MKTFALLAAAAVAVVSAQEQCNPNLVKIVSGANGAACSIATGYSPATLSLPSGEMLKSVCSNDKCKGLFAEVTAAVPNECTFNGVPIKATVVDKLPAACAAEMGWPVPSPAASNGSPSGAPSAAPGATTAAPNATTPSPTMTTPAPNATTPMPSNAESTPAPANSGGSSSMAEGTEAGSSSRPGGNDTQTPSNSSVPTPAPTSGASQLPALAGVVIATVLAAML